MKICVVGDGGWGTANAMLLSGYGHDVTLWGAFPDYIEEMRRTRRNERYLPGVELPAAVRLESDRARAAEGAEVVVLAPPSKYFAQVSAGFRGLVGPDALVVSITKGLCERTCRRMTELGEETLGIGPIVALAGPSHAEEVSRGVPTAVVAACADPEKARRVQEIWSGPRFRVYTSDDPIGNRRSSSTYNEKGEAQTSTYQANNLNQYTMRTTPGYAAVRGEADPNATVTVNENPTFRLGSYYFGSDLFDNSSSGGLANLETYATLAQTAANGEETEDLVSATTNQVYLAQSPETFAYDDDGNQTLVTTKTGRWHVAYNGENSDNMTLAMSYDHMGRRRAKNDQRFFYDGYLQVVDNGGNFYTWDCTERVATRPLAWSQVDSVAYYTHDGNKNVSEVIVSNNSIAAHYEYAPFGAVILKRGESAAVNPWRFSSEFADAKLGCVYYNYREYEPVEGRWLSRDSIQSHDIVSFVFCHNRIIRPDRLGLTDDVIVEGLGAAWAGWELTLGDKTAVRLSGEHFYVTGQPPKGSWVPKSGSTSPLIIYKADNQLD